MKLFQKPWFAWLLTALMIAGAVSIGLSRPSGPAPQPSQPVPEAIAGLDANLSTSNYDKWIWDDADILSDSTEQQLCLFNANWNQRYGSIVALATTDGLNGADIVDFAEKQAVNMRLNEENAILAISPEDNSYYLLPGRDYPDVLTGRAASQLEDVLSGDLDSQAVFAFYETLNDIFLEKYGLGYLDSDSSPVPERTVGLVVLAVILVGIILVICAIDRLRYNTYRAQYFNVATPPVMFRPLLFWHGPSSMWYRRQWHQPPPPPPPRPPRGSGGSRPGGGFGGGNSFGSGGFGRNGGNSFGSRSGGFGRSGGSSFGSRGGGFGRSGGSSFGSRGGGFGRR